jgi:carboxypeptidase C (cathepsin A)
MRQQIVALALLFIASLVQGQEKEWKDKNISVTKHQLKPGADLLNYTAMADYVIHHMFLPKELQKNISFTYYEGGHMMYIHKPSLLQLKKDYSGFLNTVLSK